MIRFKDADRRELEFDVETYVNRFGPVKIDPDDLVQVEIGFDVFSMTGKEVVSFLETGEVPGHVFEQITDI
jgi:hypothetical protein